MNPKLYTRHTEWEDDFIYKGLKTFQVQEIQKQRNMAFNFLDFIKARTL